MDMSATKRMDPPPPQLSVAWMILWCILTLGLFSAIWLFVQARWIRRVHGWGNARGWAFVYLVIYVVAFAWDISNLVLSISGHSHHTTNHAANGSVCVFLNTILSFILRDELQELPLREPLGVVRTILFGSIYFQYALMQLGTSQSTVDTESVISPPLTS